MNIIQTYPSTADNDNTELEQYYSKLKEALHLVKSRDITIILGDLNTKIGKGREGNFIGNFYTWNSQRKSSKTS